MLITTHRDFFNNKVVVVTGAASGIGQALATQFAQCGAKLALCDFDQQGLMDVAASLEQTFPRTSIFKQVLDVADSSSWERFLYQVNQQFSAIHIVINNAGIEGSAKPCWATDEATLKRTIDVNFYGMTHGSRLSLPYLAKQEWAALVNVSSIFGLIGVPNAADYCASKFAIRGYTEALRAELCQILPHIQVHLVHPGGINTRITRHAHSQAFKDKFLKTSPVDMANTIIKGIYANKPRIVFGHQSRYAHWGSRLLSLNWLTRLASRDMRSLNMDEDYRLDHSGLTIPPNRPSDK
ncbi:SDR family NAD(P)-dependent oxidoreductase [Alteromonas sediminis]|uniref:SDR family NAD(P)-dependent oxidoreductase n=1 Tax=Alteromonas sediminis TaxID=2259342 RepID=A0A3N5ZBJ2_9ALTE|nr:SDR family NAD(P)-dependent oxidoreductase [Alteromonas sediminis]RPJ68714.1 SDR family NAD(P)-dependent oxidoreductase [Alteromonas sediminis]